MSDEGEKRTDLTDLGPVMETAVFGRQVEQFLNEDPIGRYLCDRAAGDLEEAKNDLVITPAHDFNAIQALQLKARTAQNFKDWLREAIESGRAAAVQLQQERDEYGH